MAAASHTALSGPATGSLAARPAKLLLALLYALTLVGFPLASTLPIVLGVGSQAVTVPFRLLVVALTAGALYFCLLRRARLVAGATVLLSLALWLMLLGRVFLDTVFDPLPGEPGMPVSQYLLLSIGAGFLPALAFLEVPTTATLDVARRVTEVLGAIALAALLYLGLRGAFEGRIFSRLSTEILNPISVGHLGASVFLVTLAGLATSRGLAKLLRMLLIVLSLVVVVASVSRGPIVAALLLAIVHVLLGQLRRGLSMGGLLLRIGTIAGAVVLFAAAIVFIESTTNAQITSRFYGGFGDASSQERMLLFRGAWQQFSEQPLTGHAYVELGLMTYPHNLLLETMMATGVIGLAVLLLVLLGATLAGGRVLLADARTAWPALLLLQYLIALMFSGSILLDGRFWAMLFAVLAIDAGLRAARPARVAERAGEPVQPRVLESHAT
jgi:O-antigen ligase